MANDPKGLLTDAEIAAKRRELGIPEGEGQPLRAWLRFQLQSKINPKTKKPWTQADIARQADVAEPTVSVVFTGGRPLGRRGEKIRALTAQVLGVEQEVLFGRSRRQERDAKAGI